MTLTIPAACLDALGGLAETDAPVLLWTTTMREPESWHPLDTHAPTDDDGGRLILPQSAPTLLQVLARHVGADLTLRDPVWSKHYPLPPMWVLASSGSIGLLPRGLCSFAPYRETEGIPHRQVPTLTPEMSRMRALAEVVVWLARVERGMAEDMPFASMERIEEHLGMPVWEVSE